MADSDKELTTGEFSIDRRSILQYLFLGKGIWWIATCALLMAASVAAAFIDLAYLILGFMVCLIITPGVMAFLYFFYALQPTTAVNVCLHRLVISRKSIKVIIMPPSDEENGEPKEVAFNASGIRGFEDVGGSIILKFGGSTGALWLPVSAFEDRMQFEEAVEMCVPSQPDREE